MVTKTYLPSYLWESSDGSDSTDIGDSSDSSESSDSSDISDSSDSSDQTTFFTKIFFVYRDKVNHDISICIRWSSHYQ